MRAINWFYFINLSTALVTVDWTQIQMSLLSQGESWSIWKISLTFPSKSNFIDFFPTTQKVDPSSIMVIEMFTNTNVFNKSGQEKPDLFLWFLQDSDLFPANNCNQVLHTHSIPTGIVKLNTVRSKSSLIRVIEKICKL